MRLSIRHLNSCGTASLVLSSHAQRMGNAAPPSWQHLGRRRSLISWWDSFVKHLVRTWRGTWCISYYGHGFLSDISYLWRLDPHVISNWHSTSARRRYISNAFWPIGAIKLCETSCAANVTGQLSGWSMIFCLLFTSHSLLPPPCP